ncbi:hypothetical protein WA026_000005 [Henosepilachna vigintioctopunctata]|uniref:Lipid droplet-associated hydrolase n=1 Tax=Henosepilachna vigintioctopunctata TaxID=420089 RepID=A0AAW1V2U7_9CUCU
MNKMQEGFVNINNVPTHVTTFGRWITDKPETNESEEIILIIPANNGSTGFYRAFMKILHSKYHCPVWIIANSGQDIPPSGRVPENTLGLKEQVKQKVSFFEKYIPEFSKVHLIGHSVGCHMVLELLKEPSIEQRVLKAYLLFPLIERLSEGKKGISLKKYKNFQPILIFFAWLFFVLPFTISGFLLKMCGIPEKDIPFIIATCNPKVLKQVLFVANEEIEQIKERDNEVIKKNINKIRMLYEKNDGWFPNTCFSELKSDFPQLKLELSNFKHAFYLQTSMEVADVVSKWMSEDNKRYY